MRIWPGGCLKIGDRNKARGADIYAFILVLFIELSPIKGQTVFWSMGYKTDEVGKHSALPELGLVGRGAETTGKNTNE